MAINAVNLSGHHNDHRRGETVPLGSISVRTYLLDAQDGAYRARCEDFGLDMLIRLPEGLESYFRELFEYRDRKASDGSWPSDSNRIYTPCIIGRRTHTERPEPDAVLLAPPGLTEASELFVPGLAVPMLSIDKESGNPNHSKGFILRSEYLGPQEFFHPPYGTLQELRTAEFQGRIKRVHNDGKKRPNIWIIADSKKEPHIVRQNRQMLEELKSSKAMFWWNLYNDILRERSMP